MSKKETVKNDLLNLLIFNKLCDTELKFTG
jgi:hypothetical protein